MSAVADIALDAIIGQVMMVKRNGRNPNWRPDEDDFVRAHRYPAERALLHH